MTRRKTTRGIVGMIAVDLTGARYAAQSGRM